MTINIAIDGPEAAEEIRMSLSNEAARIESECPGTAEMLRGVAAQFAGVTEVSDREFTAAFTPNKHGEYA